MKKIIISILLITAAGFYGYFSAVAQPEGDDTATVEISPTTHDFGEVNFGEVVSKEFVIINNRSVDLEVRRIATSCACTTAEIDKMLIAPGEEAILKVTYDSGAMGRSHAAGREERIVYIRSNDPINPHLEVTIYATII